MCWRHSLRKKDKVSHRVTENTEKEGKKERRKEGEKERRKKEKGKKEERGQKKNLAQSSPRTSTEDTEMKAN